MLVTTHQPLVDARGPHPLEFRAADGVWRLARRRLDPDGVWLADTLTFSHGWATRRGGRPAHVGFAPLCRPLPLEATLPGSGWQMVRGFELTCLTGKERTMRARYRTSTQGGREAVCALADAIAAKLDTGDADRAYPAVWLRAEPGSRRGGPRRPQFEIVGWASRNWKGR